MKVSRLVFVWVVCLAVGSSFQNLAFAQKRLLPKLGAKGRDADAKRDLDAKRNLDKGNPADEPEEPLFPESAEPDSPLEATVKQAQEAYENGDFEECIKLTSQVLDENPRHAVARYHRASALIDLGRQDRSLDKVRSGIADARQALGTAGKQYLIFHIPYFYGLTSLSELENRPTNADLAIKVATPLLLNPELPKNVRGMVYFQRGLAKAYLKDYPGAAADYSEALKIDPQFQAAHFNRADAYVKAGQPGKAREAFDQAAKVMADDPLVFNNRGTFNLQQGRLDAAIADFGKALDLDEEFSMAALNRGFAHSQKLQWIDAEGDYLLALKSDPELVLAQKLLGTARIAQGKLKPAIEAYSQAIKLDPKDADSFAGRGYAKLFANDSAGAVSDLTQARKLNPAATLYVPWKYWAQVKNKQADAAKKELQAFVKAQPATPNWHVTLCRYILGEIDDAGLLQAANNTSVDSAKVQWLCEAHYCMAIQNDLAGKSAEARQHFEDCLKTNQSQLTAYLGAKVALAGK